MRIVAYVRDNQSRTNDRVRHFGEALGAVFQSRLVPLKCDLAIQAGFQISPGMRDAMDRGIPFIILENPVWHYGDKLSTYTFGYNGLNGCAYVPDTPNDPRRHPVLHPWKDPESGQITIWGQVEHDKALRGLDIQAWVNRTKTIVPDAHFRQHPVMVDQNREYMEPFADVLSRTSISITYSSTVGAESVIAGIPTYALSEGSLAYPVSAHSLASPPLVCNRDEWIHGLSWRHWSTDEALDTDYILSGYDEARSRAEQGEFDNMSNGRAQ